VQLSSAYPYDPTSGNSAKQATWWFPGAVQLPSAYPHYNHPAKSQGFHNTGYLVDPQPVLWCDTLTYTRSQGILYPLPPGAVPLPSAYPHDFNSAKIHDISQNRLLGGAPAENAADGGFLLLLGDARREVGGLDVV
jgi:hypothetical protein